MQQEQTILTTSEVAAELRCGIRTVYRRLQRGQLRGGFYVGGRIRIPAEALTALRIGSGRISEPQITQRAREKLAAAVSA